MFENEFHCAFIIVTQGTVYSSYSIQNVRLSINILSELLIYIHWHLVLINSWIDCQYPFVEHLHGQRQAFMMGTLVMRNELGSLESGLKDLKRSRVSNRVKVGPRGQMSLLSLLSLTFVIFELITWTQFNPCVYWYIQKSYRIMSMSLTWFC